MPRIGSTNEVIRQVPTQTGPTIPSSQGPICNDESPHEEVVLSSDGRLPLSEADRAAVEDMLLATRFVGIVL